jgi:hypothetical protein
MQHIYKQYVVSTLFHPLGWDYLGVKKLDKLILTDYLCALKSKFLK